MLGALINLLYPALCRVCSKKIDKFDHNICGDCGKKIKERLPPFCVKCGKRLKGEPELIDTCPDCKKDTLYFDRAWSACHYDDPLKSLIHDFKYKKITSLSTDFTDMLINFIKKHNIGIDCDMILSIPMHPDRLLKREINHSDILARDLGKKLGISCRENTLRKTKNTLPQSKLKREARIKNLHLSFSLKDNSAVRNKNILLVDDLFTTGSTVNECSRLLKNSGARRVEIITLARGDDA
jgi:competence protein ComFC